MLPPSLMVVMARLDLAAAGWLGTGQLSQGSMAAAGWLDQEWMG